MSMRTQGRGAGTLELVDLVKTFPQHEGSGVVTAVDHVTLSIPSGEFVTLLGPSG